MTPAESVQYLLSLQSAGIKLGLENMQRLCAALGHPERGTEFVHIAGTNGKGSVAAMLESILRAAGFRTGLYTSPHLVDFGERIRLSGTPLAQAALAERVGQLRPVLEKLAAEGVHATFFEATTALAFMEFREYRPDIVVLETGLGGRLDSTNVVDPVATAITGIGLDHREFLGATIAEIAGEKAGIIKPGRPLVMGRMPVAAREVILARARELGAPVTFAGEGTPSHWDGKTCLQWLTWEGKEYATRLAGRHQAANASVVLALAGLLRARGRVIPEEAVVKGLAEVVWPARFEILRDRPPLVLDGGHNEDGLHTALDVWQDCFGGLPGTVLFGCMRDKDVPAMVSALDLPGMTVELVPVTSPRSADPGQLAALFRNARTLVHASLQEAHQKWAGAPDPRGTLVLGSLYLAGEWKSLAESRPHQLGLNG